MAKTTRREFLGQCASAVAGAALWPKIAHAAGAQPSIHFPAEPRERISVAMYPFREFLVGWKGWDGNSPGATPPAQRIELKDFAAHVAEKFNIHRIELWSRLFPSPDTKFLEQLRAGVEKARSQIVDIAVDCEHSQYAVDPAEREQAIARSKQWVDAAVALGSPSIRTHIQEAKDSKPDVARAAETLARVAEYASAKNVVVNLENDDPVSEDPLFIVQVLDKVNSPWLRALPDFGNSLAAREADYAYGAIDAMFAHAYCICHVKETAVGDKDQIVHVDLEKTFGILKRRGYKGYCSMEYDAPGDPYKATADLIAKTVKYLS